nr:ATP-binding protein [Chryseobacterium sediminis]
MVISDNGHGIEFGNLDKTFGFFLDSLKRQSFQRSSYIKGKKGKGRYSFSTFANKAVWNTAYLKDEVILEYDIVIRKENKDVFEDINHVKSKRTHTGTNVILSGIYELDASHFYDDKFSNFLADEFGWFLFLNRDLGYDLKINGISVNYEHLIADNEKKEILIKDGNSDDHSFFITYIRWENKIGDKYYYYFLNDGKRECAKRLTSFNNNAIDFHHSVYIESSFFNNFEAENNISEIEDSLFFKNQNHPVFKTLITRLNGYLNSKQKEYVKGIGADELILKFEKHQVFPKFSNNKYDQDRKKDLVNVIKELYTVQPKIFKGLKEEQERTFVGFLNLLLDTDERENILGIIESITHLTTEEREELTDVLKRTSLSKITKTIKLLENRFKTVELLKILVYTLKKFTTEREHIQKIIEENYWLFGEQYHLVSSDQNFQVMLNNYLYLIDGIEDKKEIKDYDWKRRPDIFACRKRNIPDVMEESSMLEENILVELKRPTVTLSKKEFRQVDDYLDFILKQDGFNSQKRIWKFYLVSNKVDDYILKQYDAFKDKGKRFLVQQAGRYEIFAMTWDDLFLTFEIKHQYLLDKLTFDKTSIQDILKSKGIQIESNEITSEIINLKE